MVTLIKYGALSGGEKYNVNVLNLDGLSTDTKPTRTYIEYGSDGREVGRMGIPNGSLYTEIDTGDTYMYDVDNTTWHKVSIGGGGGGTQGGIILVGETTTQLVDNATTNPITVDGQSYTAQPNDAVIYGNKEFLFDGTKWHEFGDLGGLSSKDIGAMTNYVKAQTGADIATTDTLNQAIGKVEKRVEVNENNILLIDEELSEVTESGNLVLGKIEHAIVDSLGVIVSDNKTDMWYAKIEQGQVYAITTNESRIVIGYFNELPRFGLTSYNKRRLITEEGIYTITAPITGYIAFRSLTGYEYAQIEKGTTKTPYKDYIITAIDYDARSKLASDEADIEAMETEIATIESNVDILNRKIINASDTLYDGLNESDTYSLYSNMYTYYSICDATSGTTIDKISVLAGDGVTGIKLLLFYKSGNKYYVENLISLSNGTGEFVENTINYTLTHDCTLALNAFGYARASSGEVPKIISGVGSASQPGTELSSVVDNTALLDYTCKITTSLSSELSKTVASDIAMFENVGFCGDSYMAGMIVVSENPTVTAHNQNLCWGKILERTHGINASIFAKGGVKASDFINDTDCLPALLAASAQQLYVISLGHNDAFHQTSVSSFKTSYESILDSIIEHAPNAKIILCRQSRGYGDLNNGAELNEAISEIGEDYGLPVLNPEDDIYLSSSIYTSTQVHRHPTFAGYAGMAKAFDRQFAKATVDYVNYFKGYTGLPAE